MTGANSEMVSVIAAVCPPRHLNDEVWPIYAAICEHVVKRFRPVMAKQRKRLVGASNQEKSDAAYDAVRIMMKRRDRLFARLSKGR